MDFSELYRGYVGDVHRFSLYLSANDATAEDLTAETFVHALYGSSDLRIGTVKAVSIRDGETHADPAPGLDRRAAISVGVLKRNRSHWRGKAAIVHALKFD
jgi:hypothetical protein